MRKLIALLLSTFVLASPVLAEPEWCLCDCEVTPTPVPSATPTPVPTVPPTATATPVPSVPVPELAAWEANMRYWGDRHCAYLKGSATFDQKLASVYYDGINGFIRIHDYTRDSNYLSCVAAAKQVYRDQYVYLNQGQVPGYWNFTTGLRLDYQRSGEARSKDSVHLLATKMWCAEPNPYGDGELPKVEYSRENAYCLMAYLNDEILGYPVRARRARLVDWALGHLHQWHVAQSAPYVRAFMSAITMKALIEYHQRTNDARVVPALVTAADWLWARMWLPADEAFMYTDRVAPDGSGGREPAPDLNLLIAPVYAYLWSLTGESRFRDRHDAIFAGGVRGAYLASGKQFWQSYWWSFEGLAWRKSR